MSAPLQKLRILDMSRILAGPWAGQLLGDYGADVVKVERPGSGDDTRHWGPPWLGEEEDSMSAYYLSANRNKRSITVDISTQRGQQLIRDLAGVADVLLENFKIGTLASFGLGPAELIQENQRLIYCSISAFGQAGSRSKEPGYDAVMQGSGGLMSITGAPDEDSGGPQKVGVAICDIMAGMYATTAILAALNSRTKTGRGQHIDVPLYDSQVAWLANQNMNFLLSGKTPERMGTAHPNLVPYQTFETADGDLVLAVGNDRQFTRCCTILDLPQLATDPRYSTMSSRVAYRSELVPLLASRLKEQSTGHWLSLMRKGGIPSGPVNTVADVLTDAHARERNLVHSLKMQSGESVATVANPVAFEQTPVEYHRAPPVLGQHTDEVLRDWLRYSDAEIDGLRQDDVI